MPESKAAKQKRVLLISYHFPPNWEVGARRPYALARLLPRFGWDVIVLTVRHPFEAYVDETASFALPRGATVIRSGSLEIARLGSYLKRLRNGDRTSAFRPAAGTASARGIASRLRQFAHDWVYLPDKKVGWIPIALHYGLRLLRQFSPDVLLTTSPPHSLQLTGYFLARAGRLPWVADFRDLWTDNSMLARRDMPRRLAFERWLESKVIGRASRIVTTSFGSRELVRRKLDPEQAAKVVCIPNGYDETLRDEDNSSNGAFRIALTGRVYPGTLAAMVAGLRQATDLCLELRDRAELVLMGHLDDSASQLEGLGERVRVQIFDYGSPDQATRIQATSSLLVCAIPRAPNAESWMPYKLIEYLGRRKPVLFIGPRGEAWDLVRETGAGWTAEPEDTDGVASAILAAYRASVRGWRPPETPLVKEWSAESRVRRFAQLLDELVDGRGE